MLLIARYELEAKGKLGENYSAPVPDIYMRNQELDDQVCNQERA
jgi:hypothetical protein